MIRILLVAVAIATPILLAAPAYADEDSYLNMLSNYGFHPYTDTAFSLRLGHAVCTDLANGTGDAAEAAGLFRSLPDGYTEHDAGQIVTAARTQLCVNN